MSDDENDGNYIDRKTEARRSQFSMDEVEKLDGVNLGGPMGFTMLDPSDHGRYIHRGTDTLSVNDGEPKIWVSADAFMDVQKERDDLRRAMAFVNGFRVEAQKDWAHTRGLINLLEQVVWACETVGFTAEQGKAHNELVRWAREETRKAKERVDG